MTNLSKLILTIGATCILSCGQVRDNKAKTVVTLKTTNTMSDIEKLLDSTMPFVKQLIETHGEFFPFASAIKTNDSIAQVGTYDGDEKPLSDKLIADLKKAFRAKKEDYETIAIFYDVSVVDPNTNIKTDAVAVFVETKNEETAYRFYYPYNLSKDRQLTFSNPWKNKIDKEIFND